MCMATAVQYSFYIFLYLKHDDNCFVQLKHVAATIKVVCQQTMSYYCVFHEQNGDVTPYKHYNLFELSSYNS